MELLIKFILKFNTRKNLLKTIFSINETLQHVANTKSSARRESISNYREASSSKEPGPLQ